MVLAVQAIAAALGVFFLAASLGKLDTWPAWKRTLRRFIPLGVAGNAGLRVAVPTGEAGTAILLFVWPSVGLVFSGVLLLLFGGTVVILNSRHRGEECGCFGSTIRSHIGWKLAVRNFCLGAVSLIAGHLAIDLGAPALSIMQVTLALLVGLLLIAASEWTRLSQINVAR